MVIYTLAPEETIYPRDTILKDGLFDEIVCISILENVGMDNTRLYTRDQRQESHSTGYRVALRELRRLLMPGGPLFLRVPYGKYQYMGWQQQFDQSMVENVVAVFGGTMRDHIFFRYTPTDWIFAKVDDCTDCEYCELSVNTKSDPDFAAAARAVACIELVK